VGGELRRSSPVHCVRRHAPLLDAEKGTIIVFPKKIDIFNDFQEQQSIFSAICVIGNQKRGVKVNAFQIR
jgi:hypothetical protein